MGLVLMVSKAGYCKYWGREICERQIYQEQPDIRGFALFLLLSYKLPLNDIKMYCLTVSSEAQKCHMGLTGLNSRCQQGCIVHSFLENSFLFFQGESVSCVFKLLEASYSLCYGPFLPPSNPTTLYLSDPFSRFHKFSDHSQERSLVFLVCLIVLIFSILFPVQLTCSVALVSGVQGSDWRLPHSTLCSSHKCAPGSPLPLAPIPPPLPSVNHQFVL